MSKAASAAAVDGLLVRAKGLEEFRFTWKITRAYPTESALHFNSLSPLNFYSSLSRTSPCNCYVLERAPQYLFHAHARTRRRLAGAAENTTDLRTSSTSGMARLQLLVVVAFTALVAAEKRQESGALSIVYKQFHVDSLIVSRYAVTTFTSVVRNNDPVESKELDFLVQLPENAFISNFSM